MAVSARNFLQPNKGSRRAQGPPSDLAAPQARTCTPPSHLAQRCPPTARRGWGVRVFNPRSKHRGRRFPSAGLETSLELMGPAPPNTAGACMLRLSRCAPRRLREPAAPGSLQGPRDALREQSQLRLRQPLHRQPSVTTRATPAPARAPPPAALVRKSKRARVSSTHTRMHAHARATTHAHRPLHTSVRAHLLAHPHSHARRSPRPPRTSLHAGRAPPSRPGRRCRHVPRQPAALRGTAGPAEPETEGWSPPPP